MANYPVVVPVWTRILAEWLFGVFACDDRGSDLVDASPADLRACVDQSEGPLEGALNVRRDHAHRLGKSDDALPGRQQLFILLHRPQTRSAFVAAEVL